MKTIFISILASGLLLSAQTAPRANQQAALSKAPTTPVVILYMPGSTTPYLATLDASTLVVTGTAPNYTITAKLPTVTPPPTQIWGELPAKTATRTFVLSKAPTTASDVRVFLNGVRQLAPLDFAIASATITFTRDIDVSEIVMVDYAVP